VALGADGRRRAQRPAKARAALDAFRESVVPSVDYGITPYQANSAGVQRPQGGPAAVRD